MDFEQYRKACSVTREAIPLFEGFASRCENPTHAAHLDWMLDCVEQFAWAERLEKASRWLGFVQGVLVAQGRLTLEQAKRANMPDGAEYDGERC